MSRNTWRPIHGQVGGGAGRSVKQIAQDNEGRRHNPKLPSELAGRCDGFGGRRPRWRRAVTRVRQRVCVVDACATRVRGS